MSRSRSRTRCSGPLNPLIEPLCIYRGSSNGRDRRRYPGSRSRRTLQAPRRLCGRGSTADRQVSREQSAAQPQACSKIERAPPGCEPYCFGNTFVDLERTRAGTRHVVSAQSRMPESNDMATAMAIGHENGASVTQLIQPDRIAWHSACDDTHQESVMGKKRGSGFGIRDSCDSNHEGIRNPESQIRIPNPESRTPTGVT